MSVLFTWKFKSSIHDESVAIISSADKAIFAVAIKDTLALVCFTGTCV